MDEQRRGAERYAKPEPTQLRQSPVEIIDGAIDDFKRELAAGGLEPDERCSLMQTVIVLFDVRRAVTG